MKKYLFLLTAFLGSLTAFAAKEAKDCENLTPYWDFNNAETALTASHGAGAGVYNLNGGDGNFYANNKSNYNFSAGLLTVNGSQATQNAYLETLNKSFQLVDLQGDCGKVWVFNFSQSTLQTKLQELGFDYELQSGTLGNGTGGNMYNLYFLPAPEVYANSAKLRCRIELNVYHAEDDDTPTIHIYAEKDAANAIDASSTPISSGVWNCNADYAIKASHFRNDEGKWDANKWMVYDFPISEGTPANHPHVKFKILDAGKQDLAVLVRSIKFYAPFEDGEEVPVVTAESLLGNFETLVVKPNEVVKPLTPFQQLEMADTDMVPADFLSEFWFNSRESDIPAFFDAGAPYQCAGDRYQAVKGDNEWPNGAVGIGYGVGNADQTNAMNENRAAKLTEGVSKVDLGGSCGPVFVINNNKSTLGDVLAEMIGYELPKSATEVSPYSITYFPTEVETTATNYLVRFEVNIYSPVAKATFAALPRILKTHTVTAILPDGKVDGEVLSSEYFLDENGQWNPAQWVAYEFTTPSVLNNEPITLKTAFSKVDNAALLIRNISVYPCDASDMAADGKGLYLPFKAIEHTVGKVEFPINVHPEDLEKVPADGDKYLWGHKIRYNVPENYDLYYKIKHDETTCTHKDHQTAAPESRAAAGDEWVKNDTNEYTYAVPEPGHTEILSLKAVNRVTQHEFAMEPITVAADPILTGIEVVDADRFEGAVELYNLQGVKVDPATAAPGVYVERRGAATRKVVK